MLANIRRWTSTNWKTWWRGFCKKNSNFIWNGGKTISGCSSNSSKHTATGSRPSVSVFTFFFLKLVNVYSSELRTCWTPSKSVRLKKKAKSYESLSSFISLYHSSLRPFLSSSLPFTFFQLLLLFPLKKKVGMIFDCSQYHRSLELILGFGGDWWSRLIGRVGLGFLWLLVVLAYSCRLKLGENEGGLVGEVENEGGLVGEGEEDEKKEFFQFIFEFICPPSGIALDMLVLMYFRIHLLFDM
ncbi:hypothetical protein H5410_021001 [Solanum commersonii]|uniref:Uncharacterized protein n=1 Tax=Solanum commersonii TaxID=4109 RepID=A0A9J5ZCY8_SOLCO|nr:hypothetical protein H5410_021001 [Solanum commersonii]